MEDVMRIENDWAERFCRRASECDQMIGRMDFDLFFEVEEVDPAHLPAVLEGLAQAKRHQIATDPEVEAAFRRFEQ